jgi:hypothetical protein
MIEAIKDISISELEEMAKPDLEKIYKGDNIQEGLISDAESLYKSYTDNKNNTDKTYLHSAIDKQEVAIEVCIKVVTSFHYKFSVEKDNKQKEILHGYVDNLQLHLSRLQYQCNQLIYREQQRNNKFSQWMSLVALAFAFLSSSAAIAFTYFDIKYQNVPSNPQIEYLSDSIKILNNKIDHQNEIIEKYFQMNDSIASSKTINNKLK